MPLSTVRDSFKPDASGNDASFDPRTRNGLSWRGLIQSVARSCITFDKTTSTALTCVVRYDNIGVVDDAIRQADLVDSRCSEGL